MGNKKSTILPSHLNLYITGGIFLLIFGIGGWLSFDARNQEDEEIRRDLLRQASSVAASLSP
jgi:hypothetical protein